MGKKVLIVDDSRTIRQQVNFTLCKGGYEVVEAEDGQDGIVKLTGNSDVATIISDINMPNMNGLEMVEAINASSRCRPVEIEHCCEDLKADVFTTYTMEEEKHASLEVFPEYPKAS